MPRFRHLLLLLVGVLAAPCMAQRTLVWGGIEVIGLNKIKREAVLERLPVHVGDPVKQKEKEMLRWCDALRSLPLVAVNCAGAEVDGRVYYVVEIVESRDTDYGLRPATGAPVTARVPPEARQLLSKREFRVQEMAAEGMTPTERLTPSGIVVAEDSELRMYDAELRESVDGQRTRLVAMALDAGHPERREAIQLLAWTGAPQASLATLYPLLLDPDPAVRNEVGRLFLLFSDRLTDSDVAESMVDVFVRQLALPAHADRTKAVLGLALLYTAHRELKPHLIERAREPLLRLARESVVPNVGGAARNLLAALGVAWDAPAGAN